MEEGVKTKTITKLKERRPTHNQDGPPKKPNKHQGMIKNDLPHLSPPKPLEGSSSFKKIFNEANKILKIGLEKDQVLLERDSTLQNSNETIDNLRKNMLHLQMEYEKLDQNFQREISCRTEVVKRMEATRELVESVVQCSNVLSTSLKLLEDDKLKIAEYYEMIYQNQKEVEMKQVEIDKFLKSQDELVKTKLEEIKKVQEKITSQHSETVSQLSRKFAYVNDKLKLATDDNEKLKTKIQELQDSSSRLEGFLGQQEKLNSLHQENIISLKQSLKKLKTQRFKHQKLLKNKTKEIGIVFNRNKNLKKKLEKTELLHVENISKMKDLEFKYNEVKTKLEKELEEDHEKYQTWEREKKNFIDQLNLKESEIKNLTTENRNLNDKITNLISNENAKRTELEQIQNDLSRMLSENLQLKEDVTKLNEETKDKTKLISELEMKNTVADADLNSRIEFYKDETGKLQAVVKTLESQLSDVEKKLACEKEAKEKAVFEVNIKLEENIKQYSQKIKDLEKLLEIQTKAVKILESEKTHVVIEGKSALEQLTHELQLEKNKNKEVIKSLQDVQKTYEHVNKELEDAKKQISDYKHNLTELNSLNTKLSEAQRELEENANALRMEIEVEKKSHEELGKKHTKVERELIVMQKTVEENATLKSSNDDLKKLLETTEARLEAYKVVVKKLENERTEYKQIHTEEVSKLKAELALLEEALKKEKRVETSQKSKEDFLKRKELDLTTAKPSDLSQKINTKENEIEMGEAELWHQKQTTPVQSTKKFLSTPRKIYTSTPQQNFRSLTPIQKKRDPYEFDSDSSVERIDQDKVLKVYNRQKKETNKRTRANK